MADSGHKKNLAICSVESNLFNNLCDELVAEILLRLPSKSAIRLQVVCKRWYSLISSPDFIPRFIHLRHHRDVESSLVFQIRYFCNSGGCDFHVQIIPDCSLLCGDGGGFNLSFLPCSPKGLKLEASFADLILCSTSETNSYYVINLLTKQWIALPPPPAGHVQRQLFVVVGFLCVPLDSSHHKFMVVRLSFHHESLISPSRFEVQVFSSEDGQWRTLVVSSPLTFKGSLMRTSSSLVAYRGMLHWLINEDCIVVYDPLNTPEKFSRIIHLPIQLPLFIYNSLGVSKGRLRVIEVSDDDAGDSILGIWELEDYDSGLCNLVYKVHLKNIKLPEGLHNRYSVLSLHPENGDVIYLLVFNALVLLNMKSKTIEDYYPIKELAIVNAFHLTDQWWPTSVPSLH